MRLSVMLLLVGTLAVSAAAQRPRTMDPAPENKSTPPPAPKTVKAKYEGGVFGYNKTMEGSLSFDDNNQRLVFRNKENKEVFPIPYESITSAFADTQKRQPKAATVASAVPLIYALPAHFIKKKVRYLTLQYSDPDTKVSGVTSFKLENKELLESVLATLAGKAELLQRGEVYVRKRDAGNSP